jgi:hypothetical protein
MKPDMQCAHNVTQWHACLTTAAMEMQQ